MSRRSIILASFLIICCAMILASFLIICCAMLISILHDRAIVNAMAVSLVRATKDSVATWPAAITKSSGNKVQATYLRGMSLLWRGDYDKALMVFQSLPADWRRPCVPWRIAQAYVAAGQSDAAAEYLTQMGVKPDTIMVFVRSNQSSSDLVDAVSRWADHQGLESLPARRAQGIWLMQKGDHEKALPLLQAVVVENSTDHYVLSLVAWLHYLKGDYQRAMETIQRALELVPTDPIYRLRFAQVYQARNKPGDREQARFLLENLISEDTGASAETWSTLGWNYYVSNRSDDAVMAFENAVNMDLNNSYYQMRLAQALVQRSKGDDRERAIILLRQVVDRAPGLTEATELLQRLTQQ